MAVIFYKFNAYSHDWFMAAHDTLLGRTSLFVNDPEGLELFYLTYKDYTWCGYGCERLDKWLLTAAAYRYDVFKVKTFIQNGGAPEKLEFFKELPPEIRSFDCRTRRKNDKELEEYDAYLGGGILPPLPCSSTAAFSSAEQQRASQLCLRELNCIRRIFAMRQADFDMMEHFIREFDLDAWEHFGLTKAALTAAVLQAHPSKEEKGEFDIALPDCAQIRRYARIPQWYMRAGEREDNTSQMPSQNIMGAEVKFSWGGLHAAIPRFQGEGLIVSYDVTSYYPSIQLKYGFGREMIRRWDRLEYIHETNLKLKRAGDAVTRRPYKIADNSVSGQLKSRFSPLYSPSSSNSIAVCGQMLLLDLLEHLEDSTDARLIQANTDGIYLLVPPGSLESVRSTVREWENRTGMETEETAAEGRICQKDVNSYIIFDTSGRIVKSKGMGSEPAPLKYEMAVVRRAVREYLRNGTPPEETVNGCNRLIDFQRILCAQPGHISHSRSPIDTGTARIFASKDESDGSAACFNSQSSSWEKAPRTPPRCFIMNCCVTEEPIPEKLDRQWYIDEAWREISSWTRGEDKSPAEEPAHVQFLGRSGPDAEHLLTLPLVKKPFAQYAEEEIAAAVMRYLVKKGIDVSHIVWASTDGGTWKARLYDPQDKPGNPSTALTIHMNKPIRAHLHSFRHNVNVYWSLLKDSSMKMKPGDLAIVPEAAKQEMREKREKEARLNAEYARQAALEASDRAKKLYAGAEPLEIISILDPRSGPEYLRIKGVFEYAREHDHLLRITQGARGELLVPFENADGLVTVQRVEPHHKAFIKGCPSPGSRAAVHRIPGERRDILVLCEGLATGLSVHERYLGRVTVLVCGSCGDMEKTGRVLLKENQDTRFIVAADNDMESRDGINHGMNAAERIRSAAPERVFIDFVPGHSMDFNDAHQAGISVPIPDKVQEWLSGNFPVE